MLHLHVLQVPASPLVLPLFPFGVCPCLRHHLHGHVWAWQIRLREQMLRKLSWATQAVAHPETVISEGDDISQPTPVSPVHAVILRNKHHWVSA
jgi:hypothetical protein